MIFNFKNNKGTTLLEILIYVALIGMLITFFISFSLGIHSAYNQTFTVQETHANARVAVRMISYRLRAAKSVNIDDSDFDVDPGYLSLEMNNPLINPTVFNLDHDDGTLYMTEGFGYPVALTNTNISIKNLTFSHLEDRDNEGIVMDIYVDYPGASKDFQYYHEVKTASTLRASP